jgi:hypothetical protein
VLLEQLLGLASEQKRIAGEHVLLRQPAGFVLEVGIGPATGFGLAEASGVLDHAVGRDQGGDAELSDGRPPFSLLRLRDTVNIG